MFTSIARYRSESLDIFANSSCNPVNDGRLSASTSQPEH